MPINVKLTYQDSGKEQIKCKKIVNAVNWQKGIINYYLNSDAATVKKVGNKTVVTLHFDTQEEKKEFLENEQTYLPQNVSLAPNIKLTYQNDDAEKLKCETIMKALNRQKGWFSYWFGSPLATIDETNDEHTTIMLRFDDEEKRDNFLNKQQSNLPRGTVLPSSVKLVYANTEKEKLKYETMTDQMNWQRGLFSYWFKRPLTTIDETNDDQTTITLRFNNEEERGNFLNKQEPHLPEGVTVSPHLTLFYPNTETEKLKCQAMADALNRQVSVFGYLVGTKRTSIDTTDNTTISVTLRFDSEKERLAFLRKQRTNLPDGLTNLRKNLSPLGEIQDSLEGNTSSPTRGLQGNIKTIALSPLGECQECIDGNRLPPPKAPVQQQPVQQQQEEAQADEPDESAYQDARTGPQTIEEQYRTLPTQAQEDIEKARQKNLSNYDHTSDTDEDNTDIEEDSQASPPKKDTPPASGLSIQNKDAFLDALKEAGKNAPHKDKEQLEHMTSETQALSNKTNMTSYIENIKAYFCSLSRSIQSQLLRPMYDLFRALSPQTKKSPLKFTDNMSEHDDSEEKSAESTKKTQPPI